MTQDKTRDWRQVLLTELSEQDVEALSMFFGIMKRNRDRLIKADPESVDTLRYDFKQLLINLSHPPAVDGDEVTSRDRTAVISLVNWYLKARGYPYPAVTVVAIDLLFTYLTAVIDRGKGSAVYTQACLDDLWRWMAKLAEALREYRNEQYPPQEDAPCS